MNEVIQFLFLAILGIPLAWFMWVFIHELGHALGTFLVGFKISSFTVGPFVIYRKNGKYRFKTNYRTLKVYYGRVHPQIQGVYNEVQYSRLAYKLFFILLAGPVLEWSFVIGYIQVMPVIPFEILASIFMITWVTLSVITLPFSKDLIVAFRMMRDSVIKEIHFYCFSIYGNERDLESERFLIQKITDKATSIQITEQMLNQADYQSYCQVMLQLSLANRTDTLPDSIRIPLQSLTDRLREAPLATGSMNDGLLVLVYLYLTYQVASGSDIEEAKSIYFDLERHDSTIKSRDSRYEKKRAEHFIGLKDNEAYLSRRVNLSIYFSNEEGYYTINETINAQTAKE